MKSPTKLALKELQGFLSAYELGSIFGTGNLVKPRTLRQKARAFVKWRKRRRSK
jgi:hypothetical protein